MQELWWGNTNEVLFLRSLSKLHFTLRIFKFWQEEGAFVKFDLLWKLQKKREDLKSYQSRIRIQ